MSRGSVRFRSLGGAVHYSVLAKGCFARRVDLTQVSEIEKSSPGVVGIACGDRSARLQSQDQGSVALEVEKEVVMGRVSSVLRSWARSATLFALGMIAVLTGTATAQETQSNDSNRRGTGGHHAVVPDPAERLRRPQE